VRRALVVLGVLSACVPVGVGGAVPSSLIVARGTVGALAADVDAVAYATTHTTADTCDRVFIWQKATHRTVQLGRRAHCPGEHGVTAVAVTGGRALWLTWAGGKVRDWQLWSATTTRTNPRLLQSAMSDLRTPDQPQPIVLGSAAGGLLAYAVDTIVTTLRANGSIAFSWSAASPVVALAAADGRVAVAEQGGRVTVLDARARIVSVDLYATDVSAVVFATKGLLVQRGSVLEFRRPAEAHEYMILDDAHLADGEGNRAVWSDGKLLHVIRLPDGAQAATYAGSFAALVGNHLYTAAGRMITVRTIR
jgi:hypothetical protein